MAFVMTHHIWYYILLLFSCSFVGNYLDSKKSVFLLFVFQPMVHVSKEKKIAVLADAKESNGITLTDVSAPVSTIILTHWF